MVNPRDPFHRCYRFGAAHFPLQNVCAGNQVSPLNTSHVSPSNTVVLSNTEHHARHLCGIKIFELLIPFCSKSRVEQVSRTADVRSEASKPNSESLPTNGLPSALPHRDPRGATQHHLTHSVASHSFAYKSIP